MRKDTHSTRTTLPRQPRRLVIEELEPRILFSAELMPAADPSWIAEHRVIDDSAAPAPPDPLPEENASVAPPDEFNVDDILFMDEHGNMLAADGDIAEALREPPTAADAQTQSLELIFVDTAVADYEQLIDDLRANSAAHFEVFTLSGDSSGPAAIRATLAAYNNVDAIHIVSHGEAGAIKLGNAWLNAQEIGRFQSEFEALKPHLSARADLLFYGCDVASTDAGKAMLAQIGMWTGADVAASTGPTGDPNLGGDWLLEYVDGVLEVETLSPAGATPWTGLLATSLEPTGETQTNTDTSHQQETSTENYGSAQAIAMDAEGNYVVVWSSQNQDGSGWGVYAQRYDANGAAQGAEFPVNEETNDDQRWAAVAMDDAGNFVITWTSEQQDGTASSVYARRYHANGSAAGNEFRVNATGTGAQSNPAIAIDRTTGTFVIVWQGNGPADQDGIFFRRFDAGGTALDPADQLANPATDGTLAEHDPVVAMLNDGKFVVAWDEGEHIFYRRFGADGAALEAKQQIDGSWSHGSGLSIASNANGDFIVAFREEAGILGIGKGVWVRSIDANGDDRFAGTWIHPGTGDAINPSIALDDDGRFVLAYQKTGNGMDIFVKRFQANGTAIGSALQINQTSAGDQILPAIAMLDVDNYAVAWSGAGSADSNGVFAAQTSLSTSLTVDTVSDAADGDTSSITALLANRGGDGRISLREAITAANNTANGLTPDRIHFDIADPLVGGVHTIALSSALPTITAAVIVDGSSDPDFAGTPLVELNGTGAGAGVDGLVLTTGSDGSTIRGLIINRFTGDGIEIASSDNTVTGNHIGTDVTAALDLGNALAGLRISGTNNRIGGLLPGSGNVISGNDLHGVVLAGAGTGNAILGNAIHSNAQLGIDLGADGIVTPNDAGDSDTGANALLNFPVLTSVVANGTDLGISFTLDVPAGNYRIEFFENAGGIDASGHGEGQTWIGAVDVTSTGAGASFAVTLTGVAVTDAQTVVATATERLSGGQFGSTSEFSAPAVTNTAPVADASAGAPYLAAEGGALTLDASASSDADGDTLAYAWDLDSDGAYDDAMGVAPTISWAALKAAGIADDGSYTIGLQVDDGHGGVSTTAATLTVTNTAPTLAVSGAATVDESALYTLTLAATEPGDDTLTNWTIDWGDGSPADTLAGNATMATHTYTGEGLTYFITATATDEDGTHTAPVLAVTVNSAEDDPLFTSSGPFSVDENAVLNAVVGDIDANDGDGGAADQGITYAIQTNADPDGDGTAAFSIDAATGVIKVHDTGDLDFEGSNPLAITVIANDGARQTSATVTINLIDRNDAPSGTVLIDNMTPTAGDTLTASNTLADQDIIGGAISYQWRRDAVAIAGATGAAYVASALDVGAKLSVVATYTDNGGTSESVASADTASVAAANTPPVANDDSYAVDQDQLLAVPAGHGPLADDADADDDTLAVLDYSLPAHGNISVGGDGSFIYAPDAGYHGTDAFSYIATDGNSGITHYWRLDGDAKDAVGGANGTVTGTTTVDGHYVNALAFDGTGSDYVTLPDVTYSDAFTLSLWFKIDDIAGTGYRYLYSHGNVAAASSVNVFLIESSTPAVTANDVLRTRFRDLDDADNVDGLDVDVVSNGLANGAWHQYTLTVDKAHGASVYVDGALKANIASGGDAFNPAGSLIVGGRNDLSAAHFTKGAIDGVRIHEIALDAAGVTANFDGGAALGDVALTVNRVNTAPSFTAFSSSVQTTNEDTQIEISVADLLGAGDAADGDGSVDAFVVRSVTSGTLRIGTDSTTAAAWSAGGNDVIDATHFAYWTPASNVNGNLGAFTVVARDNEGAESATPVLAQATVADINDAPTFSSFADRVAFTSEDTETEITLATLLALGDEGDIDGGVNAFVVQSIISGSLRIGTDAGSATPWAAGTNDTIDATRNAYWTPAANANGLLDMFTAAARDNDGALSAGSGIALAVVTAVNDPPAGTPAITGTTTEDETLSVDASAISDIDGLGAFSFQWLRDGVPVAGATGTSYLLGDADVGARISVRVSYTDARGTSEGPLVSAPTAAVANVNDAPAISVNLGAEVLEGGTLALDATRLAANDIDHPSASLVYTLTSAPSHGRLELTTSAGVAVTTFTQADVDAARVVYVHDGGVGASGGFAFALSDGSAAISGTFLIAVRNINDAPRGADAVIQIAEDASHTFTAAEFGFTDPGDSTANTLLAAHILSLPTAGNLTLSGNAIGAGTAVSAADLAAGRLRFTPDTNAHGANYARFQFRVQDNGGIANGGVDLETGIHSLTIDVLATNDAPTLSLDALPKTYVEDNVLALPGIIVADLDTSAVTVELRLSDPAAGGLSTGSAGSTVATFVDGRWSASGPIDEINALLTGLRFTPTADYDEGFDLAIEVSDGSDNASKNTVHVAAIPVADTPRAQSTVAVPGIPSDLIVIEPNAADGSEVTHFRITAINRGTLVLADGVTQVHDGDFITVAQGRAGLRFVADALATEPGGFVVESSQDGATVAAQSGQARSVVTLRAVVIDSRPGASTPSPSTDAPSRNNESQTTQEVAAPSAISAQALFAPAPGDDRPPSEARVQLRQLAETIEVIRPANAYHTTRALPEARLQRNESPSDLAFAKLLERYLDDVRPHTDSRVVATYEQLRNALRQIHETSDPGDKLARVLTGSAVAASTGLSAGYVLWLLRGGMLASSMLASMPAWQIADPLPVLSGRRAGTGDDESLESIIKRQTARNAAQENSRAADKLHNEERTAAAFDA